MTPGFLRGDELIESSSGELLYVVRGVIPRIQRVKVLDMASRNEVLVDEADLRPKVASGDLQSGGDLLVREVALPLQAKEIFDHA